ncbi:hypothetical protein O3G_MSEX010690 [Manduca sexta]|uniref:Uncharacterized protein n=1 Tax=Manduca sexta TaxID=7130 RepID=A0A921ZK34_MANSE|nr:hypothetical protein O3G_MSEX010690 [Manduca sexta]
MGWRGFGNSGERRRRDLVPRGPPAAAATLTA